MNIQRQLEFWGACLVLSLAAQAASAQSVEGFTEPFRKIDVAPSEPGTLATLSVKEGDRVTANQVVATLESEVLLVTLEAAKATCEATGRLDSAAAERDLRRSRLDKLLLLREKGHALQEEVERARADLAVADANVRTARDQAAINVLECKKVEAMIERRTMRSPIHGVVLHVLRDEREFVSGNAPTVMTIVQLDKLKAEFAVPAAAARKLQTGQTLRLAFPDTNTRVDGRLEFVSPVTDPESDTVRVQVVIDNADNSHRCGVKCLLNIVAGNLTVGK